MDIFTQLTVTGSSFFSQIGADITRILDFFDQVVQKAAASGGLQSWIQDSIAAFDHLVDIAYSVGSAFLNIMDVAEKFGGGGLLGWLDQLTQQLNTWTQSPAGQKVLTDFFTTVKAAADAFMPLLPPLLDGLSSIGTACANLGVGIAPGWQTVFNTFAQTMAQLGPQISAPAPALNAFLIGLAQALSDLVAQVGPQLPQIFEDPATRRRVPRAGRRRRPDAAHVVHLGYERAAVADAVLGDHRRGFSNFVSIVNLLVEAFSGAINGLTSFFEGVRKVGGGLSGWDTITQAFENFDVEQLGKNLVDGLIDGIKSGLATSPTSPVTW